MLFRNNVKKILFILVVLFTSQLNAQSINSLTVYPTQPGVNDSVYLIANCNFPAGSCDQHTQGASISGNVISAWAIHCIGMLSVICNATDTINLGVLPAGNYTANFQLDHGMMPSPCTAGIVPGPSATTGFTVSLVTNATNVWNDHSGIEILIGSNGRTFHFTHAANLRKAVYDMYGRTCISTFADELDASNLPRGFYIIQCDAVKRKIWIE